MPSLRNIQEFGRELAKVGNEPEVLKKRGEAVEEAPPARSAAEPPRSEAGPARAGAGSVRPAPRAEAGEDLGEGVPSDIDALLASLGEDAAASGERAPAGEEPSGEPLFPEEGGEVRSGEAASGEEAAEDTFLEDFLRQSDEAEESELTSLFEEPAPAGGPAEEAPGLKTPAEPGAPSPELGGGGGPTVPRRGEGAEISDEDLFFAVPSAAELGEPESEEATRPEGRPMAGEEAPSEGLPGEETFAESDLFPAEATPFPEEEAFTEAEGAGEEEAAAAVPGAAGIEAESLFEPGEEGEPLEGLGGLGPAGEEELVPPIPPEVGEELPGALGDLSELGTPEEPGGEELAPPIAGEEAPEAPSAPGGGEELGLPPETGAAEEIELPPELGAEEPTAAFEGIEEPDLGGLADFTAEEPFEALPPEEAASPEAPPAPEAAGPARPEEEIGLPEEGGFEEIVEPEGAPPSAPEAAAPAAVEAAGGAEEDFGDFNLDDIGEQFGLTGEEPASEEELNPAVAVGAGARATAAEGGGPPRIPGAGAPPPMGRAAPGGEGGPELRLSNRDFEALQRTLAGLPRNLRIAVEELIGERELSGAQLEQLVNLLVRGASPQAIADAAGRILGRRIEIPVQYARKTGREFEEERGTFAYRFKYNILPILRVFLAGAAVLALLVFLTYRFIYNPIFAYSIYAKGYTLLERDNFLQANEDFSRATGIWQFKGWYYRYAQGFIEKHQYNFAAAKYDALLSLWPADRTAIFDYSSMESRILGQYAKAEQLLNILLNRNMYDFQALLAAGDNYLRWGAEDPTKYEKARIAYATLLQHYGQNNEVLFRMLEYFIRTNNEKQVLQLEKYFQGDKRIRVNPVAYAELGGYLIDKNNLTDVKDILFRAMAVDRRLPEIHFDLARYFRRIGDYSQESVALQNALNYLLASSPLTKRRLGLLVETYDMIGESYYREKRYLDAEQSYTRGIDRYQTALKQKMLGPAPQYGKVFADLGDLNYYVSGNFDQALRLYQEAEQNGFHSAELRYKEGYVYYRNQDFKNAMLSFYKAAGDFSDNRALLYATANTLFERNDYFAAEGYYLNLLNSLEQQRAQIANFQPDTIPADHALLVDLMKTYNNLGVTMNLLSKRSADASKYSQSLVELTRSMESFDQLTRNPVTKIAPPSVNIAYLNMRSILYPVPGYQLQIYSDIPRDMTVTSF